MESHEIEEVKQLLIKLAVIANQIDARSADALQRIEASAGALDKGVHRLDAGVERFARQIMQAIGEQAHDVIAQGGGRAVDQFNTQLQQSAGNAKWAAEKMAEQRSLLTRAQNTLVWKGLIALTLGSLLAAGGSGYLAWKNTREIRQTEFATDILRATRTGALTRCGADNALCVRVGSKPKRVGAQAEYVILE